MGSGRFSLTRSFWCCAGVILLYSTAFAAWKFLKPGSQDVFLAVNDVAQLIGQLLMVPFCLYGMGRLWQQQPPLSGAAFAAQRGLRLVPILLGLSLVGEAVGLGIYAYYEIVLHQFAPFPSWADAGLLSVYPFMLVAILLLPTCPMSGIARLRVLLDGLMIMAAVVTFSWYFLLGPTMLQGDETMFAKMVGSAYVICDLVLISCLLLLSFRSSEPGLRPVVLILFGALLVIIVTDSLYDYQTLHGLFAAGSWLEIGWTVGYMLLGLAARATHVAGTRQRAEGETAPDELSTRSAYSEMPPLWRSLLPYAFIPAVALLTIYIWHIRADGNTLGPGVYLGGAILIGLVIMRQIYSTWETSTYSRRTEQLNKTLYLAQVELRANNQALGEANTRLESLATTDPLTGLPNHRAFVATLDKEIKRSDRYSHSCTLLFLDLDHFKAINDGFGHLVGDAILCEFASAVHAFLRGTDTLGRWGGEEFVVILPETTTENALTTAERVRAGIAAHTFRAGGGLRLTCSVGIATFPTHAQEREDLVTAADRAMYGAKKLGRNQVRVVSDPTIQALETNTPGSREDAALAGTVEALTVLVEARDHYTGHHTHRVSALATQLALALGMDTSEAYMIGLAGRLQDVGKVAIPDTVLQKPTRLTKDEYALTQTHTVVGGDVVSRVPSLRTLTPIIRAHHERWDGSGYPDKLAGEHIPLGARILAVADAYEAIIADHPYQAAHDETWARAEMQRCAGTQFDPAIVAVLERVLTAEKEQATLVEA